MQKAAKLPEGRRVAGFGFAADQDIEAWLLRLEEGLQQGFRKAEELGERAMKRHSEVETNLVRRLEELRAPAAPSQEELTRLVSEAARSAVRELDVKLQEQGFKQEQLFQELQRKNRADEQQQQQRRRLADEQQAQEEAQRDVQLLESFAKQTELGAARASKELLQVLGLRLEETETAIVRSLEQSFSLAAERTEKSSELLRTTVQADLATIAGRSELLNQAIRECNRVQMQSQDEMRRLGQIFQPGVPQAVAPQEPPPAAQGFAKLNDVRIAVEAGLQQLLPHLQAVGPTSSPSFGGGHAQQMAEQDLHFERGHSHGSWEGLEQARQASSSGPRRPLSSTGIRREQASGLFPPAAREGRVYSGEYSEAAAAGSGASYAASAAAQERGAGAQIGLPIPPSMTSYSAAAAATAAAERAELQLLQDEQAYDAYAVSAPLVPRRPTTPGRERSSRPEHHGRTLEYHGREDVLRRHGLKKVAERPLSGRSVNG